MSPITAEQKDEYVAALAGGARPVTAAETVGISPVVVIATRRADDAFDEACKIAEEQADEQVEDALFQAAVSGNVTACITWLFNRAPDRWRAAHASAAPAQPAEPVTRLSKLRAIHLDRNSTAGG